MMDESDFLKLIIVPTLVSIGLDSSPSRILLLGTAIIESELIFLEQNGGGPGLGVYQIEPNTHKDIQRYLNRTVNTRLKETAWATCFYSCFPSDDALIHNLRYATVIARIKYYMQQEALPKSDDAIGLAKYHKRFFNGGHGKTDTKVSQRVFERLIDGHQGQN